LLKVLQVNTKMKAVKKTSVQKEILLRSRRCQNIMKERGIPIGAISSDHIRILFRFFLKAQYYKID